MVNLSWETASNISQRASKVLLLLLFLFLLPVFGTVIVLVFVIVIVGAVEGWQKDCNSSW